MKTKARRTQPELREKENEDADEGSLISNF